MSRNVVLVSIDSLRADHCGFHGYEKDTTPAVNTGTTTVVGELSS